MIDKLFPVFAISFFASGAAVCYFLILESWELSTFVLIPASLFAAIPYLLIGSGISMAIFQYFLTFLIPYDDIKKEATVIPGCLILYVFNVFQLTYLAADYI